MTKILIVEDDSTLNEGLCFALKKAGYEVVSAMDGNQALNLLHNDIDLAILDVNLPDIDGFSLAKRITVFYQIPILFLTAIDSEKDVLKGFELGCEDYVTKPFSLPILLEKVRVIVRRAGRIEKELYIMENLYLDFEKGDFKKDKHSFSLTVTEVKLLKFLVNHKGQVLTKQHLLEHIWDIDSDFVDENTLPVNISRLRSKIENTPSKPRWIKTVFGIGYKWSE